VTEEKLEIRVGRCVEDALREVNALRGASEQIPDEPDTVLLGEKGALDSLGLVNLAVSLEGAIEIEFGRAVGLVADLLSADDAEAFRTVGRLRRFVSDRVAASE
jgi:acyl carrier protein